MNIKKAITTPVVIEGLRSRKDGSLGLSVTTPELSSAEKASFMDLQGVNARMVIEPIDEVSAPTMVVNKDLMQKSPSIRMRNVLFVIWKNDNDGTDFDTYYKQEMEFMIDKLKTKLPI